MTAPYFELGYFGARGRHHARLNRFDERVARKWQAFFPREVLQLLAQVWQRRATTHHIDGRWQQFFFGLFTDQ